MVGIKNNDMVLNLKKIATHSLSKGFTLAELMIAVSILALIISFAIPSYSGFVERQQVKNKTKKMLSLFNGARSEAMVSGGSTICWNDGDNDITVNGVVIEPGTLVSMVDDTPGVNDAFSILSSYIFEGRFDVRFNDDDGCIAYSTQGRLINENPFTVTFCRADDDYINALRVDVVVSGRSTLQQANVGCEPD